MNKELFRKTEGKLYGYFYDIEDLKRVRSEIVSLNIAIETLDKRIRECNVKIDPEQSGCMQIMEREQAHKIRKLFKLECRERNLSYKVEKMERNISMLKEEYKKFLELKYNTVIHEKMGIRDIALELNMGKNRAHEPREKLVNDIARFNKNFGTK